MNSRIKKSKRLRLWLKQQGRCVYCGEGMALEDATLDHIVPKVHGGSNHMSNLAVSCQKCNEEKSVYDKKGTYQNFINERAALYARHTGKATT